MAANNSKYDLKSVEKQTGSMSVLGQVLTALGILAIILGAVGLVVGLVTEIRDLDMGESPVYGMAGVITGVSILTGGESSASAYMTVLGVVGLGTRSSVSMSQTCNLT